MTGTVDAKGAHPFIIIETEKLDDLGFFAIQFSFDVLDTQRIDAMSLVCFGHTFALEDVTQMTVAIRA